mmetsp:Transcript_11397/g.32261  ORF Transcript_11397/g.32261 Transcript_11397/m.32261 type:complete len:272 (+) Transcript_11397:2130-2945(+)
MRRGVVKLLRLVVVVELPLRRRSGAPRGQIVRVRVARRWLLLLLPPMLGVVLVVNVAIVAVSVVPVLVVGGTVVTGQKFGIFRRSAPSSGIVARQTAAATAVASGCAVSPGATILRRLSRKRHIAQGRRCHRQARQQVGIHGLVGNDNVAIAPIHRRCHGRWRRPVTATSINSRSADTCSADTAALPLGRHSLLGGGKGPATTAVGRRCAGLAARWTVPLCLPHRVGMRVLQGDHLLEALLLGRNGAAAGSARRARGAGGGGGCATSWSLI